MEYIGSSAGHNRGDRFGEVAVKGPAPPKSTPTWIRVLASVYSPWEYVYFCECKTALASSNLQ
jgi:hypothetical protein